MQAVQPGSSHGRQIIHPVSENGLGPSIGSQPLCFRECFADEGDGFRQVRVDEIVAIPEENSPNMPVDMPCDEHVLFDLFYRLSFECQTFVHRAEGTSIPWAPSCYPDERTSGFIRGPIRRKIVKFDIGHLSASL